MCKKHILTGVEGQVPIQAGVLTKTLLDGYHESNVDRECSQHGQQRDCGDDDSVGVINSPLVKNSNKGKEHQNGSYAGVSKLVKEGMIMEDERTDGMKNKCPCQTRGDSE